ncbi:hypothetical protein AgCh_028020 [Apium graveolens]
MNDYLETELLSMLEIQKERDNSVYVKEKLLEKHSYLEKELAKEGEVIKLWTNSGKTTYEILENVCWGLGLGYSARSNSDQKSGEETEKTELIKTDSKFKLNKVQIKTIKFNPCVNSVKSIHEEGTTSTPRSNLVTEKSKQVHTNSVNIGSMTQKQLKQKLKDLHMKDKRKRSKKNRNGKVGVNKNGNYVTPPNAPRKTYSNGGRTNHLANSCKKNKEIKVVPSKSEFRNRTGDMRNSLVLDSGCSGHMTGYKSMLSEFEEKAGPSISYEDGNLGKLLGYEKIKTENVIIKNVALFTGLKLNLISVSQIRDRGYHFNFYKEHCEIVSKSDGKIILTGVRHGSLYEARVSTNFDNSKVFLLSRASVEDIWNWHKRLSHLNFYNINELVRKDLMLYESMGGVVVLLLNRKKPAFWDGAILLAPMCKVRSSPYCYKGRPRLQTSYQLLTVSLDIEQRLQEVMAFPQEALLEKMKKLSSSGDRCKRFCSFRRSHIGSRQKFVILVTLLIFALMVASSVLMWLRMGEEIPIDSLTILRVWNYVLMFLSDRAVISALEKADNNETCKQELTKVSEKLGKVLGETDIHLFFDRKHGRENWRED